MKSIKCLILMICLIFVSFITEARGQVYSDEALFYIRSDRSLDSDESYIWICKYTGDKMYMLSGKKKGIGKQLAESISYYDDFDKCYSLYPGYTGQIGKNIDGKTDKKGVFANFSLYEIDESVPSSSRTVYSNEWFYDWQFGSRTYYAVSDDKTSIIKFKMDKDRTNIGEKTYYIKVDKEDLLPKSMNPNEFDFLNE